MAMETGDAGGSAAELTSLSPLPASDIGAFAAAVVAHVAAVAVV